MTSGTQTRAGTRRTPVVLVLAFAAYIAVTLWSAWHHEAWRDEADLWLLVRDAPLGDIAISASNGGAPVLYHLLVLPFARAGLPYLSMQLLNLAFAWAAVLLVFRSPAFPTAIKILFAFSYFPAFEFSVIARPYALQMLLTFAVAAAWRARDARPLRLAMLVALLAHTTSVGIITAAVAGLCWSIERLRMHAFATRASIVSTIVMLAGGLSAVALLLPREGRQSVYTHVSVDTLWYTLANMFFPQGRDETFVVPAMLILGIITWCISRNTLPPFFLWLAGTLITLVYVFVWMGGLRHAGLLLILVIAAIWIADSYGPYRREPLLMAALAVSLAYSVVPAWRSWTAETRQAYSGSREVATFLATSPRARDAALVSRKMFWTSPLVYLPGRAICYPVTRTCETYGLWKRDDYEASKVPLADVLAMAREQFSGRRWLFLAHTPLPQPEAAGYRLLFETKTPIWRMRTERYYVYEALAER